MKREHETDSENEEEIKEEGELKRRRVEHDILRDLHVNLKDEDEISKRLFESQKQYTTTYIYKLLKQMPLGDKLVEIVHDKQNNFEYMFTVAKSVVESTNYMRKMKSMYGVVDMLYEIGFRYVHEKIVTPSLSNMVSKEQCNLAYEKYAEQNQTLNDDTMLELQCLLYCTQETIEKNTSVKIQNPLYTRMTAQMKGMSDYVIGLLMGAAKSKSRLSIDQGVVERRDEIPQDVVIHRQTPPIVTSDSPKWEIPDYDSWHWNEKDDSKTEDDENSTTEEPSFEIIQTPPLVPNDEK